MAFVIRSERFTTNTEDENLGPGTYELTKDNSIKVINTDPIIPFSSLSRRNNEYINKDTLSNPPPGYYEKDEREDPLIEKTNKVKKDLSTELKKFLLYDKLNLNSLNKNKISGSNPGPGTYDLPNSFGKIPKYLIKNNKSFDNNNIRSNSANENDRRVLSIPHVGMDYGYEICNDGEVIQSKNPNNLFPKNINKSTNKIKYKGNIFSSSKKFSSKIIYDNTISDDDDFKKNSIENSILINKNSISNSKIINPNSKVYKRERNRNNLYTEEYLKNNNLTLSEKIDIILKSSEFQSSPGPGYYTSNEPNKGNYIKQRFVQNFGTLEKRFQEPKSYKKEDNYLYENNSNEIENIEENKEKYFNRRQIDKLGIARDKKHKRQFEKNKKNKILEQVGPGSYNLEKNYLQKSWNNKYNQFGSLANRFESKLQDTNPGPGQYEIQNPIHSEKKNLLYKKPMSNFHKNSIIKSNQNQNDNSIFDNKKQEKKKRILIDSVEYLFNDKKDNLIRPVNILEKEREKIIKRRLYNMKLQDKENESNIGPGSYNIGSDFNQKNGFIFPKSKRLDSQNNNNEPENNVGPGYYYNDRYGDWVKPSHNILFV